MRCLKAQIRLPPSPGHRLLWLSLPWRRLCHWSTSGDSAEPWGREKCMQILLQLNMLSRRLKYISRGSKYCQTARDKTPGMYACKAAPILGDLFVLFVGRQPQTWDCLGLHSHFKNCVCSVALQPASQSTVEHKICSWYVFGSEAHLCNQFGSSSMGPLLA